jgi:Tol biopolymer transport system component
MRLRPQAWILILLVLGTAVAPVALLHAAPEDGRIAFTSRRSGKEEIYVVSLNSSKPVKVVDGAMPAWSPDGRQIAYVASVDGHAQVHVINTDGSEVRQLTHVQTRTETPAWSPDGRQIAYVSYDDGRDEIYVMNVDGSNPTRLTTDYGASPAWSPDGQYIAYVSAGEIYVMNADGSHSRRLVVNHPKINASGLSDLAWSPDGQSLAFSMFVGEHDAIFTVNADGTNLVRLTGSGDFNHRKPAWSPDGQRIAFSYYDTANQEIYIMNADGSNLTRLTSGYLAYQPAWSR